MQGSATHPVEMTPMIRAELDDSAQRLARQFHGVFSEATVARAVNDSWDVLAARATVVSPFLPVMVERFAREQLQASAQAGGLILKHAPEILFVCQRNAGRSQMAAAIAHQLGRERVGVRSAGSAAGEFVQPEIVLAMAEIGLDIAMEFPKPLTDVVIRAADVVITMGLRRGLCGLSRQAI